MAKRFFIILLAVTSFTGCLEFASSFQDIDENGNGKLSAREISAGLLEMADENDSGMLDEQEFQDGLSEIRFINQWDTDGDGRVSAIDFTFLFSSARGDSETRFSDWDLNGDGTLSPEELSHSLFSQLDLNRDEALDRGEIERTFTMYDGISAYDKDGDGELSLAELNAAAVRL